MNYFLWFGSKTNSYNSFNPQIHLHLNFSIFFQLLKNGTYSGLPQMISTLSFVILLLFLFCHSGTQVTERFHGIGEEVYALEWYVLPLNLQRNIPMIIALSNNEIYLRGLGGYHYTHETFKKVNENSLLVDC